ncbi:MAG: phage tail protein [bacterium]
MPPSPARKHHPKPYAAFRIHLALDAGPIVAGFSQMSALSRTTDVVDYRDGSEPCSTHKLPGCSHYAPVHLERGLSHSKAFMDWAKAALTSGGGAPQLRKPATITVLDEHGTIVLKANLVRAWVSEFQALPDLDANANAVAVLSIMIQHEGFELEIPVVS